MELTGVASNCSVQGSNPLTVAVTGGGTVMAAFAVDCVSTALPNQIAFETDRDGNFEIYVMNFDGSNPVNLTNDAAFDNDPAWSPDGTREWSYDRDSHIGRLDQAWDIAIERGWTVVDMQNDWNRIYPGD